MPWAAEQNLHFGVLALQAGLLDALQFAYACSEWATRMDGERPSTNSTTDIADVPTRKRGF